MLTPSQIHRLVANYYVADYEAPIAPEILREVSSKVVPGDKTDHLLLPPDDQEGPPYEVPLPRTIAGLETYIPVSLPLLHTLVGQFLIASLPTELQQFAYSSQIDSIVHVVGSLFFVYGDLEQLKHTSFDLAQRLPIIFCIHGSHAFSRFLFEMSTCIIRRDGSCHLRVKWC